MEAMTLEPCPFCGSDSFIYLLVDPNNYAVVCQYTAKHGCGMRGPYGRSREEARNNWNRRAHLAQPAQAVDVELARKLIEIVRKQCGGYLSGPGHDALMVAKALDEALSVQKAGPVGDGESAAVAAIQFALNAEQGMDWLRLWNEGNFDACREEWPEAPAECYIGADPSLPASPTPGKEGA